MLSKNILFKHSIKGAALLLVFGFGFISIVGSFHKSSNDTATVNTGTSGGQNPLTGIALSVNIEKDLMDYFAFLDDLAGGWKEIDLAQLSGNQADLNITNQDGRVSMLAVCKPDYDGIRRGYLLETTLSDITDGSNNAIDDFNCKPATAPQVTTYTVTGTIDTSIYYPSSSFTTHLGFGNNFRTNWSAPISSSDTAVGFTYDVTLKDGMSTVGDLFILSHGFNQDHVVRFNDFDVKNWQIKYSSGINFTPFASDALRPVSVDASNVYDEPGYEGFNFKLDAFNTKVQLAYGADNANQSIFNAGKLSADAEDPDDMYVAFINYTAPGLTGFSSSVHKLRNSAVDTLKFDHLPIQDPDLNVTNDGSNPVKIAVNAAYTDKPNDMDELLRQASITNDTSKIRWRLAQTKGALNSIMAVPDGLSGLDSSWMPTGANKVSYSSTFANDANKLNVYRYIMNGHESTPDMDGLNYEQIRMGYKF